METWKTYEEKHKDRFLNELLALLRIPSISANSAHQKDMKICAEMVKQRFDEAGVDRAAIFPTEGHPIVFAEKIIDPKLPTILVYGHYDVQPADPLKLWHSDPFDPTIKDGKIYARGACDDKGQFYMHIKAFETMMATQSLPTNVKFLIEGEEEIGSMHLEKFIQENKNLLKADVVLISDTAMLSLENPSIDVGVRGMTYIEIELTGPNRDLHSGVYGGAVANPITMLCQMIAALHTENNQVNIPHFYDDVVEISDTERAAMAKAPFDETAYKQGLGVEAVWGEKNYSTIERTGIRPTLELNGIWGGYTGEGAKTVLPSKAFAKLSCRLVPNQNTKKIETLLVEKLKSLTPNTMQINIKLHHGGNPYVTPIDSIAYKAAEKAIEASFGKKPIPMRGGGSIPITALFETELNCKTVFLGFGLDSDNLHSPNEKFDLANFYKGIQTIPYFYKYYRELWTKA